MSYLRRHWRGELPLVQAFWVNIVLLRAAMALLSPLLQGADAPGTAQGAAPLMPAALIFHALDLLVILPWQVVGVVRATDRMLGESGSSGLILGAQIGVAFGILIAGAGAFSTFQPLLSSTPEEPLHITWERERASRYDITLGPDGTRVHITGVLEIGLTKRLRALLEANPQVEAIVLDSEGGFVAQGRAVAATIMDRGLDTYTFARCASACTLAFAGGERRFIGREAQIGFHQYVYSGRNPHPFIDYEAEYERDRAFFESRGVSPAFLDSAFNATHASIWYPDTNQLIRAGVAHGFVAVDE